MQVSSRMGNLIGQKETGFQKCFVSLRARTSFVTRVVTHAVEISHLNIIKRVRIITRITLMQLCPNFTGISAVFTKRLDNKKKYIYIEREREREKNRTYLIQFRNCI